MGLLSGTVAVTRFNVVVPPDGPDFERARFWEIEPGSEVRERMGFVPFELDAPWEAAQGRYVFRMRIDRIRPDATAVKERLRELIKGEMEATGKTFVGPKTRKKLRDLAEAESAMRQAPRTKIVECCIDGAILYVGDGEQHEVTAETLPDAVLACMSVRNFDPAVERMRAAAEFAVPDPTLVLELARPVAPPTEIIAEFRRAGDQTGWGLLNAATALARGEPELARRLGREQDAERILRAVESMAHSGAPARSLQGAAGVP